MERRDSDLLRKHAEKIIDSGQLGKSELYPKLLLYLIETSLEGEIPKEIDIALDVFGKDESFNVHEDSIVRVYVHSLRAKLEDYYREAGRDDEIRIEIPKGGYRVTAVRHEQTEEIAKSLDTPPVEPSEPPRRRRTWVYGVVAAVLAISVLGNLYWVLRPDERPADSVSTVGKTFIWAGLLKDQRPITIVLGDLFFFTEQDPELGRQRYIGDVPINSREALRVFLKDHPDRASLLGPFDTTLLTKGTAYGLAAIMPILEARNRNVTVTILDELDIEDIRKNDIIFIGPLHRLGPLAEIYNPLSRYVYQRDKNRLVDKTTGKVSTARNPLAHDGVDYGMFAEFRGPEGNQILVFGSVASDIGLLQIVRSMTSVTELNRLKDMLKANDVGPPMSFEALFSATGYGRTDLTANVIEVHPLKQPPVDDNSDGL